MSLLSYKSEEELRHLLDDYGIYHGPVVDSTRGLYEKKLREAMKGAKPSPDITYCREEDVTDVTHRLQVRNDGLGNRPCMRNVCHVDTPPSTCKHVSSTPSMSSGDTQKDVAQSSSLVPRWVKVLFFLAVAVFLYFVFSEMDTSYSGP